MRPRRSLLTVRATSEKMHANAGLAADTVLVDLEDSVLPAQKTEETRARVVEQVSAPGYAAEVTRR